MASKTVDEAAAKARSMDEAANDVTEGAEQGAAPADTAPATASGTARNAKSGAPAQETTGQLEDAEENLQDVDDGEDIAAYGQADVKEPSGAGQGAGAIVAAALGAISLSGTWIGTVAAARESLIGQLQTAQNAPVAKQVQEVYGDQWHVTALVGGIFALLALIVGAAVLARPAFGAPGASQPLWIKSVAWAGVALGIIGLLLAVLKYTDILLGLPITS
jgi:hypothetical protein